jgi:hypothetical protein
MIEYFKGDLVRCLDTDQVHAVLSRLDNYTFDHRPPQTWYRLDSKKVGYVNSSQLVIATDVERRRWCLEMAPDND